MHRRDVRRHTLRTRREFFGSEAHEAVLGPPAVQPEPDAPNVTSARASAPPPPDVGDEFETPPGPR